MPRFYVDVPLAAHATITLPTAQAHHAMRGLRLRDGDAVTLFNGQGGQYPGTVHFLDRNTVQVHTATHDPIERESPIRITLCQSLATGDKMDWVVEKAVELGATCVRPIVSERSTARPPDAQRAEKKCLHWTQVAISAAEQCGRNRLMPVKPIMTVQAALQAPSTTMRLWLDADGQALHHLLGPVLQTATDALEIELFIGPEGGWSDGERKAALTANVIPMSLGPRILRTETAGAAAISAIHALYAVRGTAL